MSGCGGAGVRDSVRCFSAMNRIETIFGDLRSAKRRALMPFICGGHPTPESTAAALAALQRAGASIVEVGIPFSDPIADGPVIAAAMHEALDAGVTPAAVFESVAAARRGGLSIGVIAMVSISIVHRLGVERFARDAAGAGFDGLIVPDAPLEESEGLSAAVRGAGLTLSLLVAPTTPPDRIGRIARASSGFVYLLARVGITGESAARPGVDVAGIRERIAALRAATELPIAVGFGISTPEDVRLVVHEAGADAAIVGSALVKRMSRAAQQRRDPVNEAEVFVRGLAAGLNG